MKFALVDGERREAEPGLQGTCPGCGHRTVAKCGEIKINHWAHLGKRMCDPWWENETEWHRAWKGFFPKEWQEFVHQAPDGEKHIADVKTDQGWVLEFQHSHLKPEERRARDDFYPNLAWVVDGKRLVRAEAQFDKLLKHRQQLHPTLALFRLRAYADESVLLRDWVGCKGPVFFDFGETLPLWCLLPNSRDGAINLMAFFRDSFIRFHRDGETLGGDNFAAILKKLSEISSGQAHVVPPPVAPVARPPSPPSAFQLHMARRRARYRRRF